MSISSLLGRPVLLFLVGLVLQSALAQTALTRFYARELAVIPGTVTVGTGSLSVLEFWSVIEEVYMGDAALLTSEAKDNTLYLGTTLSRGKTDLIVTVAGQKQLFHVVIQSESSGPLRYVIDEERPRPALEDPLNPRTPSEDLQRDLAFTLLHATPVSDGESVAFFSFANHSNAVVALDSARLILTQRGATLTSSVSKNPLRQLVEPGELHSGYIIMKGATTGVAELHWTAVELRGSGREVTFRASILIPER